MNRVTPLKKFKPSQESIVKVGRGRLAKNEGKEEVDETKYIYLSPLRIHDSRPCRVQPLS
jgi:hypothetical protein